MAGASYVTGHLGVVQGGAASIAKWKDTHLGVQLDVSSQDLSGINLAGANLSGDNLCAADLRKADLAGANLSGANLSGADLSKADLTESNLKKANLSEAGLIRANLTLANLEDADVSGAVLIGAYLRFTNLFQTDLTGANMRLAHLFSSIPIKTNLSNAIFEDTSIATCDLSQCIGLGTVEHQGPSSIDVDTLLYSFRRAGNQFSAGLNTLFRGMGVPQALLVALPKIVGEIKYHSCFICYGEPDREVAAKLVGNFRDAGVGCWMFSLDATVGEPTWREIGQKRREAEKMIVLCSVTSLFREGIKQEIEDQINEDPGKLVPVSLDNHWKHPGFQAEGRSLDIKSYLLNLNHADFSNSSKYGESLEWLLRGLERKD